MQKTKALHVIAFLCLSMTSKQLYAQTEQVDKNVWQQQMKTEELKIASYIDGRMQPSAFNDSLKQLFSTSSEHEEKEALPAKFADQQLKDYYRAQYLNAHPEVVAVYNPGRVSLSTKEKEKPRDAAAVAANILCNYGDFENASLSNLSTQGYNGYLNAYNSGVCNAIPMSNVAYANSGPVAPYFLVTNNVADPYIPALRQTHNNSNHAIRINTPDNCPAPRTITMLQKSFSAPITGKAKINFSYALVVENPPYDHLDANTFFVARVLDNTGTEVGSRICVPSTPSLFQPTYTVACGLREAKLMWKDWACASIAFDARANQTYTIEFFVANCSGAMHFEYAYVDDICADILCCTTTPPVPKNLRCTTRDDGSLLSWDPIPGVAYYKLYVNQYDPACCAKVPIPNPVSFIWNMTNTSVLVPTLNTACFSWRVVAVMPDSCNSDASEIMCSCGPKPPAPTDLLCEKLLNGSKLSWNAVPGADHYKIYLNQYDPLCCGKSPIPNPISAVWTTSNTTVNVQNTFADCFSWSIVTVFPDGSESNHSKSMCSCSPTVIPPTDLKCVGISNGSRLSWDAVPGAVYYKVTLNQYDPLCCGPAPIPNPVSVIWNVSGNTVDVSNLFASCFSWNVIPVMADGSEKERSVTTCSCGSDGDPNNPDPDPGHDPKGLAPGNRSNSIGMTNYTNLSVVAVPNPASDYIDFRVHNIAGPNELPAMTLYLYDLNGKEVIKKMITNTTLQINVRSYKDGLYVYVIKNDKNEVVFKDKVIIKK